tara:strand:- start:3295 stop:4317 length:1023 start_codon:yes stop_codon:yes gene_type:complete
MLVTFIIPVLNGKGTIAEALTSILNQKFDDMEIIVIDDNSCDGTENIVNKFTQKYSNVHLYENKITRGASYCRNFGIKKAIGQWIFFVDSDDLLVANTLSMHLEYLQEENDLVVGSYKQKKSNKSEVILNHNLGEKTVLDENTLLPYVKRYCHEPYKYTLLVHCWGKFYQRQKIEENDILFDEKLSQLEDVNFNFKYLMFCRKVFFTCDPVYVYRISDDSSSMSKKSGTEDMMFENMETAYSSVKYFINKEPPIINKFEAEALLNHLLATTLIIWFIRLSRVFEFWGLYRTLRVHMKQAFGRGYIKSLVYMRGNSYLLHLFFKGNKPFLMALMLKAKLFL